MKREAGPGETLLLTHIAEVISNTPGEVDHVLSVPAASVAVGSTEIGQVGSVTWL